MIGKFKNKVEIKGEIIGIDFAERKEGIDPHVLMNIYTGDDGMWSESLKLDSAWIDDFISVLEQTKIYMDKNFDKLEGDYGYRYKTEQQIEK